MEKRLNQSFIIIMLMIFLPGCTASEGSLKFVTEADIVAGSENIDEYIGLISGKNTGIIANQSSLVNNTHLVDTLAGLGIQIEAIFSPEHGFRGGHEAGAEITDLKDPKTGIKIISLYGNKKKPGPEDLKDIEIMLFDLQDVGARFYTYTSTMTYAMEACASAGIPFIVLDRPNPNGFYVDGPVLEKKSRSFVGLHPVPVVHGLTTGEYALMINGEGWLENGLECDLTVIKMKGYDHTMICDLSVRPSPNLPNQESVYLYPTLCLFEGTIMSIGRGTDHPFQVIGHPEFHIGSFTFTPESLPGKSANPKYEGKVCYGLSLKNIAENIESNRLHFNLSYLLNMYNYFRDENFFNPYFDKLAGTAALREQITQGKTEKEIRESWQTETAEYLILRNKYLLYPDF
jgi:uncharacterized protein YbbC (DUF1343 family)